MLLPKRCLVPLCGCYGESLGEVWGLDGVNGFAAFFLNIYIAIRLVYIVMMPLFCLPSYFLILPIPISMAFFYGYISAHFFRLLILVPFTLVLHICSLIFFTSYEFILNCSLPSPQLNLSLFISIWLFKPSKIFPFFVLVTLTVSN